MVPEIVAPERDVAVSRQRGCASHNRPADGQRSRILRLLTGKYEDFGPTLAAEKPLELDGITVSREAIRQLQIGARLWKPKRQRVRRVFQTRERRPRLGELAQIDGGPHAWFEDRGPRCTLIVFIDDATSCLMALRFAPSETARAYLETLREYVLTHDRPWAFYSDRHGIFRVNAKGAVSGDGKTGFGRVVERLGMASIQASTPQAKGRVERSNQTLQDRLAKEMRLRNISSMQAGNAFWRLSSPFGTSGSRSRQGTRDRRIIREQARRRRWTTIWRGVSSGLWRKHRPSARRARNIASKR